MSFWFILIYLDSTWYTSNLRWWQKFQKRETIGRDCLWNNECCCGEAWWLEWLYVFSCCMRCVVWYGAECGGEHDLSLQIFTFHPFLFRSLFSPACLYRSRNSANIWYIAGTNRHLLTPTWVATATVTTKKQKYFVRTQSNADLNPQLPCPIGLLWQLPHFSTFCARIPMQERTYSVAGASPT